MEVVGLMEVMANGEPLSFASVPGPSCNSASWPLDGALSQVCTQGCVNPRVSVANTALASLVCLLGLSLLPLSEDESEVLLQARVCWHGAVEVTLVFERRTPQFS